MLLSTLRQAWVLLWSRPWNALLNVLLLSLGLGSVGFLALLSHQLDRAFARDLAGIDLVVGAKGSPLQLILSGVLHVDVPTGNVPWDAVRALASNPMVAQVIPMSLGDTVRGYRIVGTTPAYAALYQVPLESGSFWSRPMEAVVGAEVAARLGLQKGSQFIGAHGLGGGGEEHAARPYTVVGVLARSGGVIDRLVLTDLTSVWTVHEHEQAPPHDREQGRAHDHENDHDHDHGPATDKHVPQPADLKHSLPEPASHREVTLALVQYRSPLAAVSLPRHINTNTPMQAAAPAVEITRLLSTLGVGLDVLRGLGGAMLLSAALGVFVAMWNAVRDRRTDLALLRLLGVPSHRLAGMLLAEAVWLALVASVLGLALAQGMLSLLAWALASDASLLIGSWSWPAEMLLVPALALTLSLLAAALPVLAAYRISPLEALQRR